MICFSYFTKNVLLYSTEFNYMVYSIADKLIPRFPYNYCNCYWIVLNCNANISTANHGIIIILSVNEII